MKRIKILLFFIIVFCFYGLSFQQTINADGENMEMINSKEGLTGTKWLDELIGNSNENSTTNFQDAQSQYVQILEKTNNQLSLSWTPYNVMLSFLLAIVSIMALIFSFFVFSQNKDYKKKLKQERLFFEEKNKEIFETIQNNQKEKIENLDTQFDETIKKHEDKLAELLEKTEVPQEKINLIEETISEIIKDKELLKNKAAFIVQPKNINITGVASSSCVGGYIDGYHRCSQCGFGYYVNGPTTFGTSILDGYSTATCPKCGNVDPLS